jgi:tetratricopeptide (TPR) repeat protein
MIRICICHDCFARFTFPKIIYARKWWKFWSHKIIEVCPSCGSANWKDYGEFSPSITDLLQDEFDTYGTLLHRDKSTESRSLPNPKVPYVNTKDPIELLNQAQKFNQSQEWCRAQACASEAIRANPSLIEAYMLRALALRVEGNLDDAISDYTKVIELDPQHGEAWMFRGACKAQKGSLVNDRHQALKLITEAHPDYQRAAELMPENELVGLALLELEICTAKYREAIGTAGVWWNRIKHPHYKVICAWLGAIASILARRPEQKWMHFQQFLKSEVIQLGPAEWSIAEITGTLNSLRSEDNCDQEMLMKVQEIHKLFMSHFSESGPAIH